MLNFTQIIDLTIENTMQIFVLLWFWPYIIMNISKDYNKPHCL
jgi:hypothetical protein